MPHRMFSSVRSAPVRPVRLPGVMIPCVLVATAFLAAEAIAAPVLTFTPEGNSTAPEITFGATVPTTPGVGPELDVGSGSWSNNDGLLAPGQQTAPGLTITTPLQIANSSAFGGTTSSAGTTFRDVSMDFNGLFAPLVGDGQASASAVTGTNLSVLTQPLAAPGPQGWGTGTGGSSFRFLTTDTDGVGTASPHVLLEGTISNAAIIGLANTGTGSLLSSTITYTGGMLHNQLVAQGGSLTGEMSISLTGITPSLDLISGSSGTFLKSFTADATGQFTAAAIPEPATLGLLAMAGLLGLRRRRVRD